MKNELALALKVTCNYMGHAGHILLGLPNMCVTQKNPHDSILLNNVNAYTVCKFKKFPLGNFFFASTVEKFQILAYKKVAILPQGTVTTLI